MIQGAPSRTALSAARHRALHQIAERGGILADPLAVRILGGAGFGSGFAEAADATRPMRIFIASRSRFADECIRRALARGVRQIVVLGAGLDLTAFRFDWHRDQVVFEVDHPDTQAWKRSCLREAGIPLPVALRFAAVDFEREQLLAKLTHCGFETSEAAIFIWLGVTPYLTMEAVLATMRCAASLPGETEIVFDYAEDSDALTKAARLKHETRMAQVAAFGEPWISLFDPASMRDLLLSQGFRHVEDRRGWETAALFMYGLPETEHGGGHIVRACNFEVTA